MGKHVWISTVLPSDGGQHTTSHDEQLLYVSSVPTASALVFCLNSQGALPSSQPSSPCSRAVPTPLNYVKNTQKKTHTNIHTNTDKHTEKKQTHTKKHIHTQRIFTAQTGRCSVGDRRASVKDVLEKIIHSRLDTPSPCQGPNPDDVSEK